MHSPVLSRNGKRAVALAFALVFAFVAAGCHRNNLTSGYSIGWITLTNERSNFASYIVQVDSVVMVGVANGQVSVLDIPETVDLTKLTNVAELWGSASVPTDQYTQAIITIDYTNADISVIGADGAPQQATVVNSTGAAVTTVAVTVNFDPTNQPYSLPTYATTSGMRLALTFDMAASNRVNTATSPATVTVAPYFTMATSAPDTKPIQVRGPLVNTSLQTETYSVYVRPFYDEANTSGTLTMFNNTSAVNGAPIGCPQANNPIYAINDTVYSGAGSAAAAITLLAQTSAGSTMTKALVTYIPTVTPSATAAIFCVNSVIAGSTLEDFYTFGLEGDVVARSGNTITVRNPVLALNADQYVTGLTTDFHVLLGTGTLVTQDGAPSNAGLNYQSVSVGQHIIARGICTTVGITNSIGIGVNSCTVQNGFPTLDSTGTMSTNTGSVRLVPTQLFGSLSADTGTSLTMNLTNFNANPVVGYTLTGTGTSSATDATAANYVVNTGTSVLPTDLAAGGPVWVDGVVGAFGSAPPDFLATDVVDEASEPATLVVNYAASTVNSNLFVPFNSSGMSFNLTDSLLSSAKINIGAEVIDITTLPAAPLIVPVASPTTPPVIKVPTSGLTAAQLPPTFLPLFCIGSSANGISCYNLFSQFVTGTNQSFAAATPGSVYAVTARGTYDRVSNQFTATAVDVILD